ncbi:hypothetical protein C7212DRAFT_313189 [Tuber magnatum]|uniref:Uncharacterized protein n=1 Tax=Tuber magnatum TaxID=42249 RepID=A0A317STI6_9PEZI|nr:hypothetical protein C7212DRAFT_313189 [Tuber magnatum]
MCTLTAIVYACNHSTYTRNYTCPRALSSRFVAHPMCTSFAVERPDFTPPIEVITERVFVFDRTCGRRELGCQYRFVRKL